MTTRSVRSQEAKTLKRMEKNRIKNLFRLLGEQEIPLDALIDFGSEDFDYEGADTRKKFMYNTLEQMASEGKVSLLDAVVMADYANAINGNTKSMEHVYSMYGEPVTSQVAVANTINPIATLSDDELDKLIALANAANEANAEVFAGAEFDETDTITEDEGEKLIHSNPFDSDLHISPEGDIGDEAR